MSLDRKNAHDEHSRTLHPTPTRDHISPPSIREDPVLIVDWDGPNDPENPRKYA